MKTNSPPALATAAGLVFAQLAMAALAPAAPTPAMARSMAEGLPCHLPDPAVHHLCIKKNCHADAQKSEAASTTARAQRRSSPRGSLASDSAASGTCSARVPSPPP